jgi:2-polyprenyl-6-hydroxyphenyl methylase / 3-demethylubiquinone-9 3-methyltransferase
MLVLPLLRSPPAAAGVGLGPCRRSFAAASTSAALPPTNDAMARSRERGGGAAAALSCCLKRQRQRQRNLPLSTSVVDDASFRLGALAAVSNGRIVAASFSSASPSAPSAAASPDILPPYSTLQSTQILEVTESSVASSSRAPMTSSVSPSEVDKFSAMDDAWWDPVRNPLMGMNATRVQYIRDQIAINSSSSSIEPNRSLRVLDVGCGGGLLCESLCRLLGAASSSHQRRGMTENHEGESSPRPVVVVGIDPSSSLIDVARKHAALDPKTCDIMYHCTTVEDYAAAFTRAGQTKEAKDSGSVLFDAVCLLEVVEHVEDMDRLDSMLSSVSALLRPHGLLFVSTVNKTWKSHALTIVGAEYLMRYLPIGTHQWHLYKSPQEVERALAPHRLRPVNVCGMVPTSVPIPMLPKFLSPPWEWKLDPNDVDVNWIGTYQKQ